MSKPCSFEKINVSLRAVLALTCLLLGLTVFGCGKKGDPEPNDPAKAFAWEEMKANSSNNCLNIQAKLGGSFGNLDYVRLDLQGINYEDDCPGCPFVTTETQEFSLSRAGFDADSGRMGFVYCPTKKAEAYRWRLSGWNIHKNIPTATREGELIILMP